MPSIKLEAHPCHNCRHVNSWPGDAPEVPAKDHELYLNTGQRRAAIFFVHPDHTHYRAEPVPTTVTPRQAEAVFNICPGGRRCAAIAIMRGKKITPEIANELNSPEISGTTLT